MAEVFVSYAHKNDRQVRPLAAALEESGYSLWWDEHLGPGDEYAMVIERELAAAGCVVVAWSASARESLWVRAEANEALDAGKLVQLTLDRSKLPLPFTMLHFLDFSRWGGTRGATPWDDLDGRVGTMLRGEAAPDPAGLRDPPLQGLAPAVWLGWAALALAALIAVAVAAAAAGALPAAQFGTLAAIGFAASAILLLVVAFLVLRVLAASRR